MGVGAITETTMEDAMLDFFYNGVSPWIRSCEYSWSIPDEHIVAKKFVYFCYVLYTVLESGDNYTLQAPHPKHRNLPEDYDTFNVFADWASFSDMLLAWKGRDEIVGTSLDYMIRDFCYVWVDVERGKPGNWSDISIEMNNDGQSDDEGGATTLPEGNWGKRKNDLY